MNPEEQPTSRMVGRVTDRYLRSCPTASAREAMSIGCVSPETSSCNVVNSSDHPAKFSLYSRTGTRFPSKRNPANPPKSAGLVESRWCARKTGASGLARVEVYLPIDDIHRSALDFIVDTTYVLADQAEAEKLDAGEERDNNNAWSTDLQSNSRP